MTSLVGTNNIGGGKYFWRASYYFFCLACFLGISNAVVIDKETGGCGGSFSGSFGNFTSPGYPNKYAENLQCKWTIKVDPKFRILIDFIYIEIEAGDGCLYDYLLFRDGLETNSPALAKICHAHSTTIKSTGSSVTVLFVTDSTMGFRGFHLTWRAVPKVPLLKPQGTLITSPWIGMETPENLRQIDSGITEYLWAVDQNSNVYVYASGNWDLVQGRMAYITAGPAVIGTSEDGFVWYRKGVSLETPVGTEWVKTAIGVRMKRVESGRHGVVVGIDLEGNVYQLQMTKDDLNGEILKLLDSKEDDQLIDVSCGSYACWFTSVNGALYMSRDIGNAYPTDSSGDLITLSQVSSPGLVKQVAAGFGGSLWIVTSNGEVFKRHGVNIVRPHGLKWEKVEQVSLEKITIGLTSVYGLTKSGVIITMEELKCGGILTTRKGMFASPDYPNIYPANLTCLWVIRVPDAIGLVVQFMKLVGIGRTSLCRDDFLVSFESGKYPSESPPFVECGDKVEDKYFQGNEAWIEFNSGFVDRSFGFQGVYDAWFDPSTTKKVEATTESPSTASSTIINSLSKASTSTIFKSLAPPTITSQSTTLPPTTSPSTKSKSTTPESKTSKSTVSESKTSKSTTSESTTSPSTTSPSTTSPSTTTSSTTSKSTTSESIKLNKITSEPSTSEPTTLESTTSKSAPSKSATSKSTATTSTEIPRTILKTVAQTDRMITTDQITSTERPMSNQFVSTVAQTTKQSMTTKEILMRSTNATTTKEAMFFRSTREQGMTSDANMVTNTRASTSKEVKTITENSSKKTLTEDVSSVQPPIPTQAVKTASNEITIPVGWQLIRSPPMLQVSVSILDIVWGLDKGGKAHALKDDSWRQVGDGNFKSLAVGRTSVWGVTDKGEVRVRQNVSVANPEGTDWFSVDGKGIRKVLVGPKNEVFAIRESKSLLRRDGISERFPYGTKWTNTGKEVLDASIGSFGIFYLDIYNALNFGERQTDSNAPFPFTKITIIGGVLKNIVAGHGSSLWAMEMDGTLLKRKNIDGRRLVGDTWFPLEGKTRSVSGGLLTVYRVLADGRVVRKQDNNCGGTIFTRSGTIKTPNYPANYSSNTNCLWLFDIPDVKKTRLYIADFDLEFERYCKNDFMITHLPEKNEKIYDCGILATNRAIDAGTFMIEFNSNEKVNAKGFKIRYRGYLEDELIDKPTEATRVCDVKCGIAYDPVCGSDGQTYANECVMKAESCHQGKAITVVTKGNCMQEASCALKCSIDYDPVCGSDGKTYANECVLKTESCLQRKVITVASEGKCKQRELNCDIKCSTDYDPVCGSDGKTYANECVLKTESCLQRKVIAIAKKGECTIEKERNCDIKCDVRYKPVCGSDGKTYANLCVLQVESCLSRKIINVTREGECVQQKGDNPYYPQHDWEFISSSPKMALVTVSKNAMVWGLDASGMPFLLMNTTWRGMGPEKFKSLFVDEQGVWGVRKDGVVRYRQGVTKSRPGGVTWVTLDGDDIKKVVTGPMNGILALQNDGSLLIRTGITPTLPIGIAWRDSGKIAKDVTIGDFGVWIINESDELQFAAVKIGEDLNSIALEWIYVNKGVKKISAGHGASLWGILSNGTVVRREGIASNLPVGTKWKVFNGETTTVSAGIHNVYRTLMNGNVVRKQDNACGGIISSMKGDFGTPTYPVESPRIFYCFWKIRVPEGKAINIDYGGFRLDDSSTCVDEIVTIMAPGVHYSFKECHIKSRTIQLGGTKAIIEFISTNVTSKRGFAASYSTLFMMETKTAEKAIVKTSTEASTTIPSTATSTEVKMLFLSKKDGILTFGLKSNGRKNLLGIPTQNRFNRI